MYLCKDYMASTLQKLVIPIFGYCNLSIPLLKYFIEDPTLMEALSRLNQYSLMFHTLLMYIEVKFCSYSPSSKFNFYLWNGALY